MTYKYHKFQSHINIIKTLKVRVFRDSVANIEALQLKRIYKKYYKHIQ